MAFNFLKSLDADDIFISYSRADGSAYLTGLDAALSAKGFSCFTDKRGTDADRLPPQTLFRKIRLCKTLVLLATPGALEHPDNIAPEVREFAEVNGTSRIICISFDRDAELSSWSHTPWYVHVQGKAREREDPKALKTGEPSPPIVNNIVTASDYMKSKDRLRKYRNRALVSFICLLAAGAVTGGFALYELKQAGMAEIISDYRSLASRSQTLLLQSPDKLTQALSLAVSSMSKATTIGIHAVEADSALRESLALLPRLRSSVQYAGHDDHVEDVSLSPDARYFAILTADSKLRIYDSLCRTPLKARQPLHEIDCKCSTVALSSGLSYAAAVTDGGIQIFDLKNGARSDILKLKDGVSPEKIALSPGGRYLALYFDEGEDLGRLSKVMILETSHGRVIKELNDLNILIHDIAFGPGGNLAVGGQSGSPQGGKFTGRVILWSLPPSDSDSLMEQELEELSFSNAEVISQQWPVNAVAPGTDSTYFATDTGVWKRLSGRMDYEPIARLPYLRDFPSSSFIQNIAFEADGQSLVLARAIDARDRNSNDRDESALEVWDMLGRRDVAHVFQVEEVTSVSFKPGEQIVAMTTEQPSKEKPALVYKAATGEQVGSIFFEPELADKKVRYVSPSGDYVVSSDENAAIVWGVWEKKNRTAAFSDVLQEVEAATVSPGGKFLGLYGPNKKGERVLVVYRSEGDSYHKWKSIPQTEPESESVVSMSLSADGRRIAVLYSYAEQFIRVWDVSASNDVSPDSLANTGDLSLMRLSPGGRFLVLMDLENRTQLLDLSKGQKAELIPLLDATAIRCLAFSSDERYLGLGSDDGILHLFCTLRPEDEIARLQHTGTVTAVAFSDDGKYLATASSDPHPNHINEEESFPLRIWLVQPTDLMTEAQERLAALAQAH